MIARNSPGRTTPQAEQDAEEERLKAHHCSGFPLAVQPNPWQVEDHSIVGSEVTP